VILPITECRIYLLIAETWLMKDQDHKIVLKSVWSSANGSG